ncbi:DUF2515 family protein [Paenibacillus eucommiae]|uniref:DUF2515 domain-containing protein n=1 Tax=Paenibacillus eucommiae TaxID=1355755 RepID=A0ABS4IWS5_9BACL|nr:DUF2515 family protein [Paenibacillus eucommiae]MBP1992029.1 hypothetical protein [Paenibacillus eucommiae]
MANINEKRSLTLLAGKTIKLPVTLFNMLFDKVSSLMYAVKQADHAELMTLSPEAVKRLRYSLNQSYKQLKATAAHTPAKSALSGLSSSSDSSNSSSLPALSKLSTSDQLILSRIRQQTELHNRNNLTRTAAYWAIYQSHPEVHWALLAHMVSRNGGWCMTDLKGDLLPHLLNTAKADCLFAFLERANALIFQDAYPQLLLYIESRRAGRDRFDLLPHLQISAFMTPVWQEFWQYGESPLLTTALIINEQNYIEQRIVRNEHYKRLVLDTVTFRAQSLMQLNQIVFPYGHIPAGQQEATSPAGEGASADERLTSPAIEYTAPRCRLAGLILEDFHDVNERIEFGKKLYALLFGLPIVREGVAAYAASVRHSGSRADYWPGLFTPIRKAPPQTKFTERLDGNNLKKGAAPLYSPPLNDAWPDAPLDAVEPGDWFLLTKPRHAIAHLGSIQAPFLFDMTSEACLGLSKIELAIIAGQSFDL